MASPPIKAMGFLCILRSSFGMSTPPTLNAILLTIGVAENAIMNASENVITYSVMYDNRIHLPML